MRTLLAVVALSACTGGIAPDASDAGAPDARDVRGADTTDVRAADSPADAPADAITPPSCTDSDMDGISDVIEGRNASPPTDTDGDGTPDYLDTDSDGDGLLDIDEGIRNYPGFVSEAMPALSCGDHPNDCSSVSGLGDWRNVDSDADGVSDHDEAFVWNTDPCNPATHDDPVTGMPISDLVWAAAGGMAPSPTALYVTLPYEPAGDGCPTAHTHRQLAFATRFHTADIFFVIDSTGSMGATITALQSTLTSTIIPGIVSAIGTGADVRIGAADYKSFPQAPDGTAGSDYIVHVGQPLTGDFAAVQSFVDSLAAGGGGDYADPMTEALEQVYVGDGLPGIPGHAGDATVQAGCVTAGVGSTCTAPNLGWAEPMDRMRDCGDAASDPPSSGFGCFQPGRVPIVVGLSDAEWVHDRYDNCDGACSATGEPCSGSAFPAAPSYANGGHTFADLATGLEAGGAYFVGIDLGVGDSQCNAMQMATLTRTLDGMGAPIAPTGTPADVASLVVGAVTTLANDTKQDVTGRVDSVASISTIAAGHTSADFVHAVTPASAMPAAPIGYDHSDATTFYGVDPATVVTFDVDFYNDFQPATTSILLFQVRIVAVGRAGTELDSGSVYIIVPQNFCGGGAG